MSESNLINPDEIKTKRLPRKIPTENNVVEKYFDKGNTVEIRYESRGRFSIPEVAYFTDFNVKQISNFSLCKPEHILENIILALNENKKSEKEFDCFDMTLEEFLETLVGLKMVFNTKHHIHRHICDCQESKPESDRQLIEHIVDLSSITYKSIDDVDNDFRNYLQEIFKDYTPEQFKEYLYMKYQNNPLPDIDAWTIKNEIDSIKFVEPIHFHNPYDENKYTFRLMRMRDIIDAQNVVSKDYAVKYSRIEKRPNPHGVPLAEVKEQKQNEIDKLKEEEAKELVTYTKAMSLISLNDKELTDYKEKISLYSELTRRAFFELMEFFEKIEFGINHEITIPCSACGKAEARSLQSSINPLELLPLGVDTTGEKRDHTRLNIYFGI